MNVVEQKSINVNEMDITYYRIGYDTNGNQRYVVHFLSLGIELKDYGKISGLKMYRAKWFGGGYIFTSSNLEDSLKWMLAQVDKYYERVWN
jgi:hypothetical protein